MRLVLTNLGEKMTDEEVDELLKAVDTTSGELNYIGTDRCSMLNRFTNLSELVRMILAN